MKKVWVDRVVKEEKYEAFDGVHFSTENQCREYENNRRNIVRHLFNNIPHVSMDAYNLFECCYSDYSVYVMMPRDLEDIKVINEHYSHVTGLCNEIIASQEYIGKRIVLTLCYDCEYMDCLGTLEQTAEDFCSKLNNLSHKLDEKLSK